MKGEVDDEFDFCPLQPPWLRQRIEGMFFNYHDQYESFASQYSDGSNVIYEGTNITLDQINVMRSTLAEGLLPITGPFMPAFLPEGEQLFPTFWPKGKQPVNDPEFYDQMYAACWGLALWQIYGTLVNQTFIRTFKFGYYGRKRLDD
uniref:Uncharacterized protein n=1 Tax=uncultured prokaryote TaxID=198431 RepID=A0A0H5QKV3_9ZZZZ|nr:hypothetical protein [uncultured prokaryote]